MPKLTADHYVTDLEEMLEEHPGLAHIRVRKRADTLTLVSGPKDDPVVHARFRRETKAIWSLDMPTHMGVWQPTPFEGSLEELFDTVIHTFPWTVAPRE